MLHYAFKDSAMKGYIAICREVTSLYRKYALDVLRSFVGLLSIIIVSIMSRFTLIVTVEQPFHLIDGNFTLDVSASQVIQIF